MRCSRVASHEILLQVPMDYEEGGVVAAAVVVFSSGGGDRMSPASGSQQRAAYWLSSLESQATIFTLPTCSVVSSFLNCASVNMNVHTLSQNL